MRKVFLFAVVLVMVMGISFSSSAAPGGFISSPSGNKAPEIIEGSCFIEGDNGCSKLLVITPFSQRQSLDEIKLDAIESAYDDIVGAPDITVLTPELDELAEGLGIPGSNLAVSDLFDIGIKDCDNPSEHTSFSIKLKAETLKNFVGLMYKHDGEWKVVSDATISGGDTLTFTTSAISPFAVIVDSEGTHIETPPTGDDVNLYIYIVLMAVSAVALVLVGIQLKKKTR